MKTSTAKIACVTKNAKNTKSASEDMNLLNSNTDSIEEPPLIKRPIVTGVNKLSSKFDQRSSSIINKLRERIFNIKPKRVESTAAAKRSQRDHQSTESTSTVPILDVNVTADASKPSPTHLANSDLKTDSSDVLPTAGNRTAGQKQDNKDVVRGVEQKGEENISEIPKLLCLQPVEKTEVCKHETTVNSTPSFLKTTIKIPPNNISSRVDEQKTNGHRETTTDILNTQCSGEKPEKTSNDNVASSILKKESVETVEDSVQESYASKKLAAFVQTPNSIKISPLNFGRYLKPQKPESATYRTLRNGEDDPRSNLTEKFDNESLGWCEDLISFKKSCRIPHDLIYVTKTINKYVPQPSKFMFDTLHGPPPSLLPASAVTVGKYAGFPAKPRTVAQLRRMKRMRKMKMQRSVTAPGGLASSTTPGVRKSPEAKRNIPVKPTEAVIWTVNNDSAPPKDRDPNRVLPLTLKRTVSHTDLSHSDGPKCKLSPQRAVAVPAKYSPSLEKSAKEKVTCAVTPKSDREAGKVEDAAVSAMSSSTQEKNNINDKGSKERNIWASLSLPVSPDPVTATGKTDDSHTRTSQSQLQQDKPKKEFNLTAAKKFTSNLAFLKNVTKQFTKNKLQVNHTGVTDTSKPKLSVGEGNPELKVTTHSTEEGLSLESVKSATKDSAKLRRDSADSDRSASVKRRYKRSLLSQIANSDGYVAESKLTKQTDNLYADPSQLGREERALQRAIMQFSQLEMKKLQSDNRKEDKDAPGDRNVLVKHKASTPSPRNISRIKFTSASTGKSGRRASKPFHKDAAYERVLIREEERCRQLREMKRKRDMARIIDAVATGSVTPDSALPDGSGQSEDVDTNTSAVTSEAKEVWQATLESPDVDCGKGRLMLKLCRRSVDTKEPDTCPLFPAIASPNKMFPGRNSFAMQKVRKSRIGARAPKRKLDMKARLARRKMASRVATRRPKSVLADEQNRHGTTRKEDTLDAHAPSDVRRLAMAARKNLGETVLHRAARMGYEESVRYCLENGTVDVNARDNTGFTALHECCVTGNMVIVRELIDHGADVNCSSHDGTRPIHDAVDNDHIELVRLLLSHGADPTLATYTDKTPLQLAQSASMSSFLTGVLTDLNGPGHRMEESPWEFQSPYLAGTEVCGFDVLADCPSDEDSNGLLHQVELSDLPTPSSYTLRLGAAKKFGCYMLLEDVLKTVNFSRADFLNRYDDVRMVCVTSHDFHQQLMTSQVAGIAQTHEMKRNSYVELVEVDDALRKTLRICIENLPKILSIRSENLSDNPLWNNQQWAENQDSSLFSKRVHTCKDGVSKSVPDFGSKKRSKRIKPASLSLTQDKENVHRMRTPISSPALAIPVDSANNKSQNGYYTLENIADNVQLASSPDLHDFKVATTPEECFSGLTASGAQSSVRDKGGLQTGHPDSDTASLGYVSDVDEPMY